eukprot:TRINITY_DN9752_c0_g4_i3.p1 TRINITY_DN9752_c0_g4~~TRINITY_DN9752_c0_g4_i3.p1  ORF type:complete len:121 (+),score=22.51 TRINITY_DN9752_c0_g4_i3:34-396(+)
MDTLTWIKAFAADTSSKVSEKALVASQQASIAIGNFAGAAKKTVSKGVSELEASLRRGPHPSPIHNKAIPTSLTLTEQDSTVEEILSYFPLPPTFLEKVDLEITSDNSSLALQNLTDTAE